MTYVVNWVARIVTIPVGDLTLVSGSRYRLEMSDFHKEIRRLEWEFDDGLWAAQILDHTIPKLDFVGTDYAAFDEVVNGYTVKFDVGPTRVDLVGSNNNIVDVLVVTGISVVPSNTAGLVRTGESGLTTEESEKLDLVAATEGGRWHIVGTQMIFYEDDNATEVARFNLLDSGGSPTGDPALARQRVRV